MQTTELFDFLVKTFPEFKHYWEEDQFENSFSAHGVMMAFTGFYLHYHDAYDEAELIVLAKTIEAVIVADTDQQDPLAEAIGKCFLENLPGYAGGQRISAHLGQASQKYYKALA